MADDFNFEGLKKAAERLMLGERRCLCFDHDHLSLKDESFRLFLRFRHHFHLKITEAETRSLNQQMKIDELEAQLSEAEEIIVDLREQLRQVLDELEIVTEKHNSNISDHFINESVPLDNEKSYLVNEYNVSDQKSISLDPNSDGMVVNKCGQALASTTWHTKSDLNYYYVSKDGITSLVHPNRDVYLYKNGCTERVCAIESNRFVEFCPPGTGHTLDNFLSENRSEKSDNNSRNLVIDKDHISGDLILCEKLDNANQDQLKKAGDNDNPGDKIVGSYETGKNETATQNGLGELVVHENGGHKAQESRSCRRSPGKNARYREAISVLRRSCRKKPSRSWQKPLPRQQNVLSSGVNEESVEVPIKVIDKMPKTEGDSTFARETPIPSDTLPVDSNLVDVPIIDGSCNPQRPDNKGKVLKFTFYRKRRKNVLTNIDENIFSDRSAVKRKL